MLKEHDILFEVILNLRKTCHMKPNRGHDFIKLLKKMKKQVEKPEGKVERQEEELHRSHRYILKYLEPLVS